MRQKNTKHMLDYWLGLFWEAGNQRGGKFELNWPARNDVQPAQCRSILGNMFILERDGADVTYRLAGTQLCSLYGREMKQETFARAFGDSDQRSAENWVYRLGLEDYILLMCSLAQAENGEMVNIETLLLPLIHGGKPGERILGITTPCENPAWMGTTPLITQSIRSVRVMRPWETLPTGIKTPAQEPAFTGYNQRRLDLKSPAMFSGDEHLQTDEATAADPLAPRRVKHLRIFDGGLG
jgi:hypothetical protein